jgi:ribonucleoside-diphosphate reductase alpha chain
LNFYQQYIDQSRYARWIPDLLRREIWGETVDRTINFLKDHIRESYSLEAYEQIPWDDLQQAIYNLEVMPSMRLIMTAGKAAARDHAAIYNCTYLPIDDVRAFDEVMYLLMCGTGVGFSVERQLIGKLPEIADEFHNTDTIISVRDSRIGWSSALRELISLLYAGSIPKWDTSKVRPAGARLHTFGGRASGPEPLEDLFRNVCKIFQNAAGRRLNSVECHDIVCWIADTVIVGGVRRSALLSLSNLSDNRMRDAKTNNWWDYNGQRELANNSVAYTEKPDNGTFLREWASLYESKSGERGIFNRQGAIKKIKQRGIRNPNFEFGTNPCGEIVLRPNGLCNLTEAVIRPSDTYDDIKRKLTLATILGTIQSTFTNFRYLRPIWKRNADEERLLGVSLTGIMDHSYFNGTTTYNGLGFLDVAGGLEFTLDSLREETRSVNDQFANILGINHSAAITCVKPSGTVSQLVDSSSGIHARYAKWFIRRVRADNKDVVTQFLKANGFPWEPHNAHPDTMSIFSFPMKSPDGAITRNDRTALEQLEIYRVYAEHWCDHNPSVSIYVKEEEWLEVLAWIHKHWNICNGLSFFPSDDHVYKQPPYEEITEEQYNEMLHFMPKDVDFATMVETEDTGTGYQELACKAGVCDI